MKHSMSIGVVVVLTMVAGLCFSTVARAGAGACTICTGCPEGTVACFAGGTPTSICAELDCSTFEDTSKSCLASQECPNTEAGVCTDGLNNDAWQNGETDCADAACANDPACVKIVPAASNWGLAAMALFVLSAGTVVSMRRRVPSA